MNTKIAIPNKSSIKNYWGIPNFDTEMSSGEDAESLRKHMVWLQDEFKEIKKDGGEIKKRMSLTFYIRRKMILEKKSIQEVLAMFPFIRSENQVIFIIYLIHLIVLKSSV